MKVLVTGALGNVGGYVVEHLLKKQGVKVAACDIDVTSLKKRFSDSVECKYFDFTKPETFADALKGADCAFIMRPPHLGDPQDLKPFIEAMKAKADMKLVSFLSLLGVEHNPVPPHHKIEKYIEQANLPFCHIRPSFFMQNISGVHAFEIKHFDRIVVPVKNAPTSFIDAEDIGKLVATVLSEPDKHKNTAYSVTGPEALDYYEAAKILSEKTGREIVYANPAPKLAKRYWIDIRGLDKNYSTVMGMLYMMTRLGTAKKVNDVFEQVVGEKPSSFAQFVEKNLSVWQKD